MLHDNQKYHFYSLLLSSCLMVSSISWAGSVKMFNTAPSAEQMGDILFSDDSGQANTHPMSRTRSITFSKKKPAAHMQQQATPKSMSTASTQSSSTSSHEVKSIGLPIKFASNSAQIMQDAIPFLNEIGKMLTMKKHSDKKLLIEGHTDAAGSEEYNLLLSYRRAKAVRNYLVNNFHIDASRLKVSGKGESEPLEGSDPMDGINRRVQFYKAE